MRCSSCGADVPDDALFCIQCGVRLRFPVTGETVALPRYAEDSVICNACRAVNPSYAAYCVRCGASIRAQPSVPTDRFGLDADRIGIAVFLIGLGVLLLTKKYVWPGILIVMGIAAFAAEAVRGRVMNGVYAVIWLFGLGVLFLVKSLWLPGLLALAGLTVLLEVIRRALNRT